LTISIFRHFDFAQCIASLNNRLITKIKKNMKNALMHLYDKIALRKRVIIETVNDLLKNGCQMVSEPAVTELVEVSNY